MTLREITKQISQGGLKRLLRELSYEQEIEEKDKYYQEHPEETNDHRPS